MSPDATGRDLVELVQTGKSSAASGRNFQIPGETPSLKAKPIRKHKWTVYVFLVGEPRKHEQNEKALKQGAGGAAD